MVTKSVISSITVGLICGTEDNIQSVAEGSTLSMPAMGDASKPLETGGAPMSPTSVSQEPNNAPLSPTKRGWGIGLPSMWIVSQNHLPKLPESDSENSDTESSVSAKFTMEDSYSTTPPGGVSDVPFTMMDSSSQTQEAPELGYERLRRVAHGTLQGKMRRNAQSFDERILESASDMAIPMDFAKQQDGFVTSLYKSIQQMNRRPLATISSQPSSAESSRCGSPTGFLSERVRDSKFSAATPGLQNKGREAFFRDLNVTGPSSW